MIQPAHLGDATGDFSIVMHYRLRCSRTLAIKSAQVTPAKTASNVHIRCVFVFVDLSRSYDLFKLSNKCLSAISTFPRLGARHGMFYHLTMICPSNWHNAVQHAAVYNMKHSPSEPPQRCKSYLRHNPKLWFNRCNVSSYCAYA